MLAELREAEARQRAFLAVLPDLMFRLHRDGTYLGFAGDLTRLATPAEDLLGSNMHEILPADVAEPLLSAALRAIETVEIQAVEYRLRTYGGELCDFEARVVRLTDDEAVTIVRDVTARKAVERERHEARARIAAAEVAERRRLQRNLHDGAQQQLVTANLNLHLAERYLQKDPEAARQFLAVAQSELEAGLADIRQLSHGLNPPVLATEGLGPAIAALAERSPVSVEVEEVPRERLPDPVEAAAYYVVAEALTNAAKHAQATRVAVTARVESGALRVGVVDDGVGGAATARGTGLTGLADRVAALGGRLDVVSPAGGGTSILARIPVDDGG